MNQHKNGNSNIQGIQQRDKIDKEYNLQVNLDGYRRCYQQSYFGINTEDEFEKLTTFKVYDFQTELRASQAIIKGFPLKMKDIENVISNLLDNSTCRYCKSAHMIKFVETSGSFNFVRFCCSQLVQFMMSQNVMFQGKRLIVQRIQTEQNDDLQNLIQVNDVNNNNTQNQTKNNDIINQYLSIIGIEFENKQTSADNYEYFTVTATQKQIIEKKISEQEAIQFIQHDDSFILKAYDVNHVISTINNIIQNNKENNTASEYQLIVDNFPESIFEDESKIQQILHILYQQFQFIESIDVYYPINDQNIKQQFDYSKMLRYQYLKPGVCCFLCSINKQSLQEVENIKGIYDLQIGIIKYTDIHFCLIK